MEINNWLDFFLYVSFSLGIIFILFPFGINLTYTSITYMTKNGFKKFPEGAEVSQIAKSPLELLLVGLFALSGSYWYLFIDSEGNLFRVIREVKAFLGS